MPSLFQKFQEAVKTLAKNPFESDPRYMRFQADLNRLFLLTSHKRLGRNVDEADAAEIIDMASKVSAEDQQKQVEENIHSQVKGFCLAMDEILLLDSKITDKTAGSKVQSNVYSRDVHETQPLKRSEVSQKFKNLSGYTLDVKPSHIPSKKAGEGLFINGEADVGTMLAFYPGIIYSPTYYPYIPGYPKVGIRNPYIIKRYDGTVINAQPWGFGGETCGVWDGFGVPEITLKIQNDVKGTDQHWRILSKPLEGNDNDFLEQRNPLAFGHFANFPAKGMVPNVMIFPYDFPLTEKSMRTYIPNVMFAKEEPILKGFGSFWFKPEIPVLETLVLVTTRAVSDEELLMDYRLIDTSRRAPWYTPVNEEEENKGDVVE